MDERNSGADAGVTVAADIGGRSLSYMADIVLFSVSAFVALLLLSFVHGPVVNVHRAGNLVDRVRVDAVRFAVDTLVVCALSAVYFAGSWRRWGATPGQRLSRIEVRPADRRFEPGARLGLGRAIARWLALGVPLWVAAGVSTGNLRWALWLAAWAWYAALVVTSARSPSGQGLHDRMAGTAAIRTVHVLEPGPPVAGPATIIPVPADA